MYTTQINADNAQAAGLFDTYNSRIDAAKLGLFSIDTTAHREKRAREAAEAAYLDRAYSKLGLDRARFYDRIASHMEASLTGGVWAKSSGAYGELRERYDRAITHFAGNDTLNHHSLGKALLHGRSDLGWWESAVDWGWFRADPEQDFWLSPKAAVYGVRSCCHDDLIYSLGLSWEAASKAGWLHVSDGRVDHYSKLTHAQRRYLDTHRRPNGHDWNYKEDRGGDNRPIPLDTPLDYRPSRERDEEMIEIVSRPEPTVTWKGEPDYVYAPRRD